MKISSLFSVVVLALSLTSAAAYADTAPYAAAATIDVEKCVPNAAAPCEAVDPDALAVITDATKIDEAALPVPEPETFIMLMLGLVVLGIASRRRVSERFES